METSNPELKNIKKIITIYLKITNNGRFLSVTDNAEGMTADKMKQIFGEYGGDNAGGSEYKSRGIFGQGASDVLQNACSNNKEANVKSIKDGVFTNLQYINGDNFGDFKFNIESPVMKKSKLDDLRKSLGIPNNGTCVTIGIPDEMEIKVKKFAERIETYYMFKYLLNDHTREVKLVIDDKGKKK